MARRGQDGGRQTAQAGAKHSLEDAVLDFTSLLQLCPMSEAEKASEQHTKALDLQYFAEHPEASSYLRPYHRGEIAAMLLLPYRGREPEAVAVALVCPGRRGRVMIWPGMLRASARHWVEEAARRDRIRLGLQGEA